MPSLSVKKRSVPSLYGADFLGAEWVPSLQGAEFVRLRGAEVAAAEFARCLSVRYSHAFTL